MTRDESIAEITQRLVEFYHPVRVYLFGSVARGDDGPDSDLDFCVVLPDGDQASLKRRGVHSALQGISAAADVVRFLLGDFEGRAAHVKASLPAAVVREGKLLYDTGRIAA